MYLRQRDIIFRNFGESLARWRRYVFPPTSRPPCISFSARRIRSLPSRDEGGERQREEQEKLRDISYRGHVRAEVNFERRMSLLKLSLYPKRKEGGEKKSCSSIIAPASRAAAAA